MLSSRSLTFRELIKALEEAESKKVTVEIKLKFGSIITLRQYAYNVRQSLGLKDKIRVETKPDESGLLLIPILTDVLPFELIRPQVNVAEVVSQRIENRLYILGKPTEQILEALKVLKDVDAIHSCEFLGCTSGDIANCSNKNDFLVIQSKKGLVLI